MEFLVARLASLDAAADRVARLRLPRGLHDAQGDVPQLAVVALGGLPQDLEGLLGVTCRWAISTPLACSMTARDSIARRMLRACSPSCQCASALATATAMTSAASRPAASDSGEAKAAGWVE